MDVNINAEKFYERLERLQNDWLSNKGSDSDRWGGADAICIPLGLVSDELSYSKAASFHVYMFGYEFADSLVLITKNTCYFMATAKKCSMMETFLVGKNETFRFETLIRTKDESLNKELFASLTAAVRKSTGNKKKIGSLFKTEAQGNFIPSWMKFLDAEGDCEKVEIAAALGCFFSKKDDAELELLKRAAVLSNKVLKHGFLPEMERILDEDAKESHENISKKVEDLILDPNKIGIKISVETVDVAYTPIVQSGGVYDIKPSAVSDERHLSADVILCSLGARYKSYCANVSRTYIVDAPKKVEDCYSTLLGLYNVCLEQMIPGRELKAVVEAARGFLQQRDPELLNHLPKSFGSAIGLEFRDNSMLLNASNSNVFTAGMVFNLSVGFQNISLSDEDKASSSSSGSYKQLSLFSLLLADVVCVQAEGVPEVLTKASKDFADVSYNIGDKDGDDGEEEEEDGEDNDDAAAMGVRRSKRALEDKKVAESAAKSRSQRQQELMQKKLKEARARQARGIVPGGGEEKEEEVIEAVDLATYRSNTELPAMTNVLRLRVDTDKEALLVPINGRIVPFHISTIKNITSPDPDMRINFYTSGGSLSKEVNKNMAALVVKYGDTQVFIKELTFRSTDGGRNLSLVYQQFQELRKRVRARELKAEQEKDLVVQAKLIRIKDQRVPRLQEVTMRPQLSGRKCIGTLEAHQNGLRFVSSKGESLDVMYQNVKHAIFQPCDRTIMVLVHFHLRDPIIINKKKHRDVQFYTEVVDSSLNLNEANRASYDPDELDDEQREREMRKRLNSAFRDFCQKVEKVAAHYEFDLQIDIPFKKSAFEGNCSREMVLLQPTTHCLVNLTEWPSFVLTLSEVEHVHFERVQFSTKGFDLVFVNKNWEVAPRIITAVQTKYMDIIEDWLNLIDMTYTKGPRAMNWTDVMRMAKDERDYFYDTRDDEGNEKPAGWLILSAEGNDSEDDEEEDEDSNFSEDQDDSSSAEEEDDSDEDFDDEDEDEDEDDPEDELEEKGMDWDEMERTAAREDRQKRERGEDQDPVERNAKQRPVKKSRR